MAQDTLDTTRGSATSATSGAMGSFGTEQAASSHGGTRKSQTGDSRHAPASKEALRGYGYTGDTGYPTGDARTTAPETAPTWAEIMERHPGRQGSSPLQRGKDAYTAAQSQALRQVRSHPWLTLTLAFAIGFAMTSLYRVRADQHRD